MFSCRFKYGSQNNFCSLCCYHGSTQPLTQAFLISIAAVFWCYLRALVMVQGQWFVCQKKKNWFKLIPNTPALKLTWWGKGVYLRALGVRLSVQTMTCSQDQSNLMRVIRSYLKLIHEIWPHLCGSIVSHLFSTSVFIERLLFIIYFRAPDSYYLGVEVQMLPSSTEGSTTHVQ